MDAVLLSKINALNSSKMGVILSNHIFADTTARDTYFTSNPSEKTTGRLIQITGTGFQSWNGSSWVATTGIVKGDTGSQGPAGATGATGPQGPAGADGVQSSTVSNISVVTQAAYDALGSEKNSNNCLYVISG